jgi:uncharacterized membrane protein (UPF0127 family)
MTFASSARPTAPAPAPARAPVALLLRLLVTTLLLGALAGCKHYTPALPTTSLQLGIRQYVVEIASDEASREKGLMFRPFMPDNYGMIFVFDQEHSVNFYMKNTQIPLDIVFLDHAGRVISIKTMLPLDLRLTPSDGPVSFAIELNAGQGAATGLRVGDVVSIPSIVRQSVQPPATSS